MRNIFIRKKIGLALIALFMFGIFFETSGQTDSANPYPQLLFPSFARSMIKMKSGVENAAFINYNTVDEEMLFDQKGVYVVLDKPQDIDTIYVQNRKFVYVDKAFYEVIVKDPLTMYIQHKSKYAPVGTPTAYGMTSQTNARVTINTARVGNQVRSIDVPDNVTVAPANVYWIKVKGVMNKFTTQRQFLKILPDKEKELNDFINKNRVDFKKTVDVIKLINYCNEIYK